MIGSTIASVIASVKFAPVKYDTQVAAIIKCPIVYTMVLKIEPEFSLKTVAKRFLDNFTFSNFVNSMSADFPD